MELTIPFTHSKLFFIKFHLYIICKPDISTYSKDKKKSSLFKKYMSSLNNPVLSPIVAM